MKKQGQRTVMLTVQTPMRTDKEQGIQHAQQVVHTGENPQIRVDSTTSFFESQCSEENLLKKVEGEVSRSRHNKSIRINTTAEQHLDLAPF